MEAPSSLSLGAVVLRHPFLVILSVLLLVGAAVAVGVVRKPTYAGETRLSVGQFDVSNEAIPGVVQANQSLAATFSRLVSASGVIDRVAARVGMPSKTVTGSLRASPIPESPIIRIETTAPTARRAVQMANIAGEELTRYVGTINRSRNNGPLLKRFRDASSALARTKVARDAAQRSNTSAPSQTTGGALAVATANYEVANIRFTTLRNQISVNAQGDATTNPITTINPATKATSDYNSTLQRLVLIGLVSGLALGVVLALAREGRTRRAARA